jgi:hypothetical protein
MYVSFFMSFMPRILSVFCILYFVFCIFAIPAQAAGIGISVEPFLSDLVFEEGEVEKPFVITLSNGSPADIAFDAFAVDFGSLDISAGVAFLGAARDIEQSYARASWIALEESTVVVPAEGTAELRGKLVNTAELAPGGHYGSILLTASHPDGLEMGPANVAIDQRISALVFLKKKGGERYSMELTGSESERNIFGMLRAAKLSFKNTGNVHIVPRGQIDVIDPMGRLIAKGIINEDSSIVLPQTTRDIAVRIRSIATAWVPGTYVSRMGYRYDGREAFESFEERRVVVPPAFLAALLVFFALIGAGYLLKRRKKDKG